MTAQLPAQQSSIFNSSGDIFLKTSVVYLFYFIKIYKPGVYHRCENPVRSQSEALCCFWGSAGFSGPCGQNLKSNPNKTNGEQRLHPSLLEQGGLHLRPAPFTKYVRLSVSIGTHTVWLVVMFTVATAFFENNMCLFNLIHLL